MPRLSEWAGGAGEWTSGRVVDYVSMGCVLVCICVCVCVCEYVCMQHCQAHSEQSTKRSDGGTEA